MRQPSRSTKRKRFQPEDLPSSATREVFSIVRKGGRVTQKRIIEGTDFDPRTSTFSLDDGGVLPILVAQADPSEPSGKHYTSKEPPLGNPSRSVSVSLSCVQHVITHSSTSRRKYRNGSHTGWSSSMNSSAWKLPNTPLFLRLLLSTHPASNVNPLQTTVVSAVFRVSSCARIV